MTSSLGHRRWLLCLLVLAVAVPAGVAGANVGRSKPTVNPPGLFLAKYHLSGYGIYHQTEYRTYVAAPCQRGGRGGGDDGTVRIVTAIRWESAVPQTVRVQKIGSGPPALIQGFASGTNVVGMLANATVTNKVTNSIEIVSCHLDGTEERKPYEVGTRCGTHTYARGYSAGVDWPKVQSLSGQRIAVQVASRPVAQKQFKGDWGDCYGAVTELEPYNDYWWEVNAPLPFNELPRKVRGKLSVIAHGGKVVRDETMRQNGQGGTIHDHLDFNATNYVTWIRVG